MILSLSIASNAKVAGLKVFDACTANMTADARVALSIQDPKLLIQALCGLDGRVATMLLLSHSLAPEVARILASDAGCTHFLTDADIEHTGSNVPPSVETQWLMTTSGTTGVPKIVPHTLASLARSVRRTDDTPVWGLIYDPTRFAGLQVVLQSLIGGGKLVTTLTGASPATQAAVLAAEGCTHLSATPTWWRRLLMLPDRGGLVLQQVTLGGEIADQPTLNALRSAFPEARITHIYASTEAGVGFSVKDGREGFPAAFLNEGLEIHDDVLWLGSPLISSGDRVEVTGDRVRFLGRENGMINIGGVKVFPETVETLLMTVPGVAIAKVSAKRSPVTGALVMAEVQLVDGADPASTRADILELSRARLVREAVPAIIRFVDGFQTNAAGKLIRIGG